VPDDPKTVSVSIIEDLREVREWLVVLVNGTAGFRCAGSYRTMEEALAKIAANPPDVVVTDLGLPGMSGTDGIRILRGRYPLLYAVSFAMTTALELYSTGLGIWRWSAVLPVLLLPAGNPPTGIGAGYAAMDALTRRIVARIERARAARRPAGTADGAARPTASAPGSAAPAD